MLYQHCFFIQNQNRKESGLWNAVFEVVTKKHVFSMLRNSHEVKIREEYLQKCSYLVTLLVYPLNSFNTYVQGFWPQVLNCILQNTFQWLTLDITEILKIFIRVIPMASMKLCSYWGLFFINSGRPGKLS